MKVNLILLFVIIFFSFPSESKIYSIGQLSVAMLLKKLGKTKVRFNNIIKKIAKRCPHSVITTKWKNAFMKYQVSLYFLKQKEYFNLRELKDFKNYLIYLLKIVLFCSVKRFKKQRKLVKLAINKMKQLTNINIFRKYLIQLTEIMTGDTKKLFKNQSNYQSFLNKNQKNQKNKKETIKVKRKLLKKIKELFAKKFTQILSYLINKV